MSSWEAQARLLVRACGGGTAVPPDLGARLREVGGLAGADRLGLGPALGPRSDEVLAVLRAAHADRTPSAAVAGPEDVARCLGRARADRPVECFWVLCLDARGGLTELIEVSCGTLTACLVHPREVFAPALVRRAASVVVAHNHPSGDPRPSPEDLELTDRLVEAGELLGVPMLDHVIVAGGRWWSWAADAD
jgi:DNA repair protein RadC